MTMQKWQSARVRTPYESPQAEVLVVGFEEQFLQSPFNSNNNESLSRGLDEDFD